MVRGKRWSRVEAVAGRQCGTQRGAVRAKRAAGLTRLVQVRVQSRELCPEAGHSFVLFPVEWVFWRADEGGSLISCSCSTAKSAEEASQASIPQVCSTGSRRASPLGSGTDPSAMFRTFGSDPIVRACLDCLVAQVRRWASELRGLVLSKGAPLCPTATKDAKQTWWFSPVDSSNRWSCAMVITSQ